MYAVGSASGKGPIRLAPMKDFVLKPRYALALNPPVSSFKNGYPRAYHSQPQPHRMESDNLSFLRSALHNGHILVHMAILQMFLTRIT